MATKSDERGTENFQASPGSSIHICLEGTDDVPKDLEVMSCSHAKKRRITYDKEFLVECFQHPASSKKPSEFPLPNLECTLGSARLGKSPFSVPYLAPKRKEENGKKEKEAEDNISLRPHSGNFSSGCAPNLSPAHMPHNSFTRFQMHEDQSRNMYDRDLKRNNYRINNNGRLELNERNRPDRDRDRDREREMRDREQLRDRGNRIQTRRPNSHLNWGSEPEQSDWNRRRNGNMRQEPKESRRTYYDKNRDDDQEPEWFSGGPTSQHETIELRGFMDDERREHPKDKVNNCANLNSVGNSSEASINSTSDGSTSAKSNDEQVEETSELDLSIEKILKMDHISGILPNGILEDEAQPSGSSRFSQLFQRNSTPIHASEEHNKKAQMEPIANYKDCGLTQLFKKESGEEKSIVIQEMENTLRTILLTNKKEEEIQEKPPNSDIHAFKMLLQQVVQGNKTGAVEPDLRESPIFHGMGPPPGWVPGIIPSKVNPSPGAFPNRNNRVDAFIDLFKMSSQPPSHVNRDASSAIENKHPQSVNHTNVPNVNHSSRKPLQPQIYGDNLKKPHNRNVMTPAQFLRLLTSDVQELVANAPVDYDFVMRPEVSKIVNALTTGEIDMGEIIEQLAAPRSQHRHVLVGIVKLCLHGAFSLPSITIHPVLPRNSAPPGSSHAQQKQFYKKGTDELRDHAIKRCGTPVASMAFTPTAVMRKMTGDQPSKQTPLSSQNNFPVFPASANTIATHQAALVNAMSAMTQVHQYPPPPYQTGFTHGRPPYPVMMGPGNPSGMPMHPMARPPYMNYHHPMPMMGQPDSHNQKHNLSDDLTKLLTAGGQGGEGNRSSGGPQHPMALSLEEVEQMQLRSHGPKYQ